MLPFTRHGTRELLIGSVVLLLVGLELQHVWWPLGLLVLPAWVFLFAFFRDPERAVPPEQHLMVSPADGVVSDITPVEHDPLIGGPGVRIGIFLSVFNVHVNRAPCDAAVLSVTYKKGKFINAMRHDAASDENESNTIVLGEAATGEPIAVVKQIVGLIARRIVCTAAIGQAVHRGQRIGMIKFGSRTELTIAGRLQPEVRVVVGQKVLGASTVLAAVARGVHVATGSVTGTGVGDEQVVDREIPT